MAEVPFETNHVWCHQLRIAFFLSAMRHFREALRERGDRVCYHELSKRESDDRGDTFGAILRRDVGELRPERLVVVQPGDARVLQDLEETAKAVALPLEVRADTHFYESPEGFREWADGRKLLVLENYYRHLRKRHRILLSEDGSPEGGEWNFDRDNRESFDRSGPPEHKEPRRFAPDPITTDVLELVRNRFAGHPGSLDHFDLPVTRREALAWLREFIKHRLPRFGSYQDAMWTGERFLFHSRLSCLLNTKLLNPRECIDKAVEAYREGEAPINSVEGFVRQVLGWREFVRGIYWLKMPGYLEENHFGATAQLPSFFWDGKTDMRCVRDAMENVLRHGYAHHIQRLMVLGLFAQLSGVNPRKFHDWHVAMYLDAIDWASAPNTIGMSQFADGGVVGTKPYCASGNYINRMSNYCKDCRFKPGESTGKDACPFTTFYWDFLGRNYGLLKDNRRMVFQLRNYDRKATGELGAISRRADELRDQW